MSQRRNQKDNQKVFELNENENTTYQKVWDSANAEYSGGKLYH